MEQYYFIFKVQTTRNNSFCDPTALLSPSPPHCSCF